jgi:hypothetical protein
MVDLKSLFFTWENPALCIFVILIILTVYFHQEKSEDERVNDIHYWRVIGFSTGITGFGLLLCFVLYYKKKNREASHISTYYPHYELRKQQRRHTLDNIFGFLASLAITSALTTFYLNYLALISPRVYDAMPLPHLIPELESLGYIIPIFHLIDFFVIAVSLTHSGYLFLSTLANESYYDNPKNTNPPFRLIGVFVFSMGLIGLLFFLAGSIASSTETVETINGELRIVEQHVADAAESTGFVFWLTLIVIVTILWSCLLRHFTFVKSKSVGIDTRIGMVRKNWVMERIHKEWIWLDVITLGFLISLSLTIFRLYLINTMYELLYFNIVLSAVLIVRTVLNYYIGLNVYFPDTPTS